MERVRWAYRRARLSEKTAKAHKLWGRMTFRGLPISIETAKGGCRHCGRCDGEKGKTHALRLRLHSAHRGLDEITLMCSSAPNEQAKNVYVVMTNKAPDPKERDEEVYVSVSTPWATQRGHLHGAPQQVRPSIALPRSLTLSSKRVFRDV